MASYEILSAFPSGDKRKFLAVQRGFSAFRKLVVARQVLDEVRNDDEAFHAFLREAKVAAVFSHPNIADLYDLEAQENQLLLISEFVPGATLGEVMRACRRANLRLPLEVTLRVIQHAAMGLQYAHNFVDPSGRPVGLVHRNLSDEAVQISFEGLAKITDFCIPVSGSAQEGNGDGREVSPFHAPEYGWGDQLDARADVYSLGVLLQRAIAELRQPGPGANPNQVPAALDAVVQRATARAREQRFASAYEFAKAVDAAAGRGWEPVQLATFMQRLFQDRRAKMAELVKLVEVKETTAVMKLSDIFEGGGAAAPDVESAINEATNPRARSPYFPQPEEQETNPGLRPAGAPAARVGPADPPVKKRRFGAALLRTVLLLIVIGAAFAGGAYLMNPPRAVAIARTVKARVLKQQPPADQAAVAAPEGTPSPPPSVTEAPDAGELAAEVSTETLDAGEAMTSEPASDAGTGVATSKTPPTERPVTTSTKKKKRRH